MYMYDEMVMVVSGNIRLFVTRTFIGQRQID